MKKLIAATAAVALGLFSAAIVTAQDSKGTSTTGVLIDNKCAKKTEAESAKHPKACAAKCIAGGEAAVVMVGDKKYKLDENGTKLAKEYLAKEENKSTRVKVTGEIKGDTINATAITAAPEEKGA